MKVSSMIGIRSITKIKARTLTNTGTHLPAFNTKRTNNIMQQSNILSPHTGATTLEVL